MSITDYATALQTPIAATPFVVAISLSSIRFLDGSQLYLKEFIITGPVQHVIKYAYHYRRGDQLLFRYDNARDPAAKHLKTFPHHKHMASNLRVIVKSGV